MADSLRIFGSGFSASRFSFQRAFNGEELEAQQRKGGIATRTPSGHMGDNRQSATDKQLGSEVFWQNPSLGWRCYLLKIAVCFVILLELIMI